TSTRLPGERAVRGPGDIDAGWVGGGPAAEIVIRGAELVAPEEVAVRVVLPKERVVAAGVRLPGERAHRRASDIDTRRVSGCADVYAGYVDRDGGGPFGCGGAELAGPQDVSSRVVLPEERVHAARACLTWERAERIAGNVHAGRVCGDSEGVVVQDRAELPGPPDVAGRIVLSEERVRAARTCLPGERAEREAGNVDAG